MGLHLDLLNHRIICVTENLNRARSIRLCKTGKEEIALVANKDLRVGHIFLISKHLLVSNGLSDAAITASRVDDWV